MSMRRVRRHVVPVAVKGAVVAVTRVNDFTVMQRLAKQSGSGRNGLICFLAVTTTLTCALPLTAAVLPEERIDALFHYYNGGGITIQGPALQASMQAGNNTSLSAKYYVDSITSASIDVVTSASKYTERREEKSVSATYLRDRSTLSLNYVDSEESDFVAKSAHFNISQEMFGDLTTLYMGYSKGWDSIYSSSDAALPNDAARQNFRLGITQILSKELIANLKYELITDKGFLNNPYRVVRFSDGSSLPEIYPNTHSSNAINLSVNYYLPYRAALHGSYRFYNDTWGINADTFDIGYTHPYGERWILGGHFRTHSQNRANFYQDLFDPYAPQNYMARDKELSTFRDRTLGLSVSYNFIEQGGQLFDKGTLNFSIDHIRFDYDDFSDLRDGIANARPYAFSANVIQLYASLWY